MSKKKKKARIFMITVASDFNGHMFYNPVEEDFIVHEDGHELSMEPEELLINESRFNDVLNTLNETMTKLTENEDSGWDFTDATVNVYEVNLSQKMKFVYNKPELVPIK